MSPEEQFPPIEYASPYHLEIFNRFCLKQAEYLNGLKLLDLPEPIQRCWPLIRGIVHDTESLCLLARSGYANQSYMVFRAWIEKVLTLLYLQVAPQDDVDAFFQYSAQKTYRLMDREMKIDGKSGPVEIKFEGKVDLSLHPKFKAAVEKFTSASGKAKTRWSSSSIDTKLRFIKDSGMFSTTTLEYLIQYLYDDGSEALHGTLYGCLFHIGVYQPGWSPNQEEMTKHYRMQLVNSFWFASNMLHELNAFLLTKTNQLDILEKSKEGIDLADEYMVRALKNTEKQQ